MKSVDELAADIVGVQPMGPTVADAMRVLATVPWTLAGTEKRTQTSDHHDDGQGHTQGPPLDPKRPVPPPDK